ncbi:thiamine pyrophosphate-binding protein [Azospirillum doebereinerae]|uniref:thiamine pyrophosphate-binding protein n=1 Tax=Azospirillum doebereinerae TaxID=92933 RepID=UPI001EE61185|nr:thiamine pyrophosphate-binding protein [Azospirillum doebereinerae]MCG5243689.1 thiamine pyrophosphate-binding protein [Azospirillum doebereinerae]
MSAIKDNDDLRLTGGRAVARALADNGVTDMFGIHGYINNVLDEAFRLGIRNIHFRHEQSAGFAADAYGRIKRKAGVCYASSSGGMSNYLAPLSQGIGALSPMLLLVGQHGTAGDGLDILQEGYAAECFKPVTKWTKRLTDWEMNSYWTQKALREVCSFPPGPICLEIPLNNQWNFGSSPQRKYLPGNAEPQRILTAGDPSRVQRVADLVLNARRPIMVVGDGIYWSDGIAELKEFAELMQVPTNSRRTARGAISEMEPLGVPAALRSGLLEQADLILLVGVRAGELESWFEAPDWPRGKGKYVQINETAEELWYALPSEECVVGSSRLVLRQLIDLCRMELGERRVDRPDWIARVQELREKNAAKRRQLLEKHRNASPIHTYELTDVIANVVDADATIIYDSYSGSLYLTDAVKARYAGQILDAGPRVALGQGIGMSIGAAVARPGKQVVTLVGDGGMGIAAPDIETMIHYKIPAVIVVLNNSSWGGNSLMGDDIHPNIDWSVGKNNRWDLAFEAFGAHGEFVERSEDLKPAMLRALASGKPAVVNVVADCDGTEYSQAWLRLKSGDMHSRGLDQIGTNIRQHFKVSPLNALRIMKAAQDNGTQISLSFIAELTGNPESSLRELAEQRSFDLGG